MARGHLKNCWLAEDDGKDGQGEDMDDGLSTTGLAIVIVAACVGGISLTIICLRNHCKIQGTTCSFIIYQACNSSTIILKRGIIPVTRRWIGRIAQINKKGSLG